MTRDGDKLKMSNVVRAVSDEDRPASDAVDGDSAADRTADAITDTTAGEVGDTEGAEGAEVSVEPDLQGRHYRHQAPPVVGHGAHPRCWWPRSPPRASVSGGSTAPIG